MMHLSNYSFYFPFWLQWKTHGHIYIMMLHKNTSYLRDSKYSFRFPQSVNIIAILWSYILIQGPLLSPSLYTPRQQGQSSFFVKSFIKESHIFLSRSPKGNSQWAILAISKALIPSSDSLRPLPPLPVVHQRNMSLSIGNSPQIFSSTSENSERIFSVISFLVL